MFETILNHLLFAVSFLVEYKPLLFHLFHDFLSFSLLSDLPTEVILSAILLPIKSHVAFAVFRTTILEAVFVASIPVFFFINYLVIE